MMWSKSLGKTSKAVSPFAFVMKQRLHTISVFLKTVIARTRSVACSLRNRGFSLCLVELCSFHMYSQSSSLIMFRLFFAAGLGSHQPSPHVLAGSYNASESNVDNGSSPLPHLANPRVKRPPSAVTFFNKVLKSQSKRSLSMGAKVAWHKHKVIQLFAASGSL